MDPEYGTTARISESYSWTLTTAEITLALKKSSTSVISSPRLARKWSLYLDFTDEHQEDSASAYTVHAYLCNYAIIRSARMVSVTLTNGADVRLGSFELTSADIFCGERKNYNVVEYEGTSFEVNLDDLAGRLVVRCDLAYADNEQLNFTGDHRLSLSESYSPDSPIPSAKGHPEPLRYLQLMPTKAAVASSPFLGETCDVTFQFADDVRTISAHKAVLVARSPVFRAMFEQSSVGHSVEVVDGVEYDAFERFLRFFYCGSFRVDGVAGAREMLALADRYNVRLLSEACEEALVAGTDPRNVSSLLRLAKARPDSAWLEEQLLEFVAANCSGVIETPEFKLLMRDDQELALKVVRIAINGGVEAGARKKRKVEATTRCASSMGF